MKNLKVLLLTALLVVVTATTAFAWTKGWGVDEEGYDVYYIGEDRVATNCFKQSASGNWYWLDGDGYYVTNAFINYQLTETSADRIFYVDEDGVMVTGWKLLNVALPSGDYDQYEIIEGTELDDEYYAYFSAKGQMYRAAADHVTSAVSGSNNYLFDENGIMLTGWVAIDGSVAATYGDAAFYCGEYGDIEDGVIRTGWQQLELGDDFDSSLKWFFFSEKKVTANTAAKVKGRAIGEKYADETVSVSWGEGKKGTFNFNKAGIMTAKAWVGDSYYDVNGYQQNGWFQAPVSASATTDDWFFAVKGAIKRSQVFKDGTKYYLVNNKGQMLTGVQYLYFEDGAILPTEATAYDCLQADGKTYKTYALDSAAVVTEIVDASEFEDALKTGAYYFSEALNSNNNVEGCMTAGVIDEVGAFETTGLLKFKGVTGKVGNVVYVDGEPLVLTTTTNKAAGYAFYLATGSGSKVAVDFTADDVPAYLAKDLATKASADGKYLGFKKAVDYKGETPLAQLIVLDAAGNVVKSKTVTDGFDYVIKTDKNGQPTAVYYSID